MTDEPEERRLITPPPGLLPAPRPREADAPVNTASATRRIPAGTDAPVTFTTHRAGPVLDATQASPGTVLAWTLELGDGSRHEVAENGIVVGRNPSPPESAPDADALAVVDPERTVSKTHAVFRTVDGELRVTDLSSTNGVSLTVEGVVKRIAPGDEHRVVDRSTVALGSFPVLVRRGRRLG